MACFCRDLPDKDNVGKGDPYVEIFYTEEGKKEEIKIGRTATLTDTANPDWGDEFEFDFVRNKRQVTHQRIGILCKCKRRLHVSVLAKL
jgi:Ca2+-dependent lipid-binding protein